MIQRNLSLVGKYFDFYQGYCLKHCIYKTRNLYLVDMLTSGSRRFSSSIPARYLMCSSYKDRCSLLNKWYMFGSPYAIHCSFLFLLYYIQIPELYIDDRGSANKSQCKNQTSYLVFIKHDIDVGFGLLLDVQQKCAIFPSITYRNRITSTHIDRRFI